MSEMTVHCLVRNEERFIRAAILSVLPQASRVLVYDTGSTDATLEILDALQDEHEKIEVVRKTFSSPRELTRFRNEMIERTDTEWFWLVDGDEIYPAHAVQRIAQELERIPPTVHQIKIHRRHFLGSVNFISPTDCLGRIYRTSQIRHRTGYPLRRRLRADTPYLRDDPLASLKPHSMRLADDLVFFHCQYLARSSKDAELGRLRRWRTPPLPALPYFGPWPETLPRDGAASGMSPSLVRTWIGLNTKILKARCLALAWSPPAADGRGARSGTLVAPPSMRPGEPPQPITVMFLQTSLRIGGAEMMLTQLIERLDRRKFSPMLCCLYEPGAMGIQLITADLPVYHHLASHRWDLRVGFRLLHRLWRERVQVLYIINQPLTQFWGTLCGRLAGVPVIITAIHSTGKISRIRRRQWVNWLTFRFVDRITALSQTHKSYLVSRERIDPEKLEIISNGIEIGRFSARQDTKRLRAHLGLPDGDPVVGIVAMLRPEKAHAVFLQAAAEVLKELPRTQFLIVGDGPERPRLEALAQTLGIADQVRFLGVRQDVPALVHLFDVAVLCSRPVVETLSVSVLEYMAAGKPVVATRVGSLPELIEEGRTGFLVDPADPRALADRVLRLLGDRRLADQMGQAGQQTILQRYTVEQMVQRTETLFETLQGRSRLVTVMFVETALRIGGAEMMLTQLIERLDRRRFRPIVCCFYEPGVLGERLRHAGVSVYHHLAGHRWDLWAGVRLLRLLRRERVQILYIINQPLTQFWGTLCGRLARVPVLISAIRSTGKISRVRRRLLINRLTFPWVSRVTALSQAHQSYLIERERITPAKLEIIPNGVDLERFALREDAGSLRRALGLLDGDPVVGIVAMLRPEKAHEVFLQAAAEVLKALPSTQFLIVGDGPERPRLEALAQTLRIAARIHFLGARQDVPALVKVFDVGVLSSHPVVETLSNAVLEYMAAGKPVVATRVGSLPELIEEGRTGFLVAPGDWKTLAQRIKQLLQDRQVAERMGRTGQDKVDQHYTLEQMVHSNEALFDRLMNHRKDLAPCA